MHRVLFMCVLAMSTPAAGSIVDSSVFINEFHYDNSGSDRDEFVEIAIPAQRTDLSGISLTLYNGGSGSAYRGPFGLDSFTRGDTTDGWTFYVLETTLQNGPRDGLALADGQQILQLLSYEGTFQAVDGLAEGLLSTDVGVTEPSNTPLGFSLQLAGTGDSYSDFTWQPPAGNTAGQLNHHQTLDSGSRAVPEPAACTLWASLCMLGALLRCATLRRAGRRGR